MQNLNYYLLATTENEAAQVVSMEESATENAVTQIPAEGTPADGIVTEPKKPGYGNLILMGAIMVVMFFFLFRGPRKQQKEAKKMRESLQKNDIVKTIGGILGTIIDITDTEVTLKIDESNNTKMKLAIAAIAGKAN